jgi:NTP pyrophosphatase (non-canonical NTP hydrolase)
MAEPVVSNLRVAMDALQKMVTDWSEATFPASTLDSIYKHLKKEVKELGDAYRIPNKARRKRNSGEEAADCVLLIMHLCRKQGISLYEEIEKKFGVNVKRKWGKPNRYGFQEHVRGKK